MIKLLCYDIENDKLRTKLADLLERQGLERLQFSVFAGNLNPAQWQATWQMIEKLTENNLQPSDKIYCFNVSNHEFCNLKCIGNPPETDYITGKLNSLYF
jgi:CRISPR-associated protein Cas2